MYAIHNYMYIYVYIKLLCIYHYHSILQSFILSSIIFISLVFFSKYWENIYNFCLNYLWILHCLHCNYKLRDPINHWVNFSDVTWSLFSTTYFIFTDTFSWQIRLHFNNRYILNLSEGIKFVLHSFNLSNAGEKGGLSPTDYFRIYFHWLLQLWLESNIYHIHTHSVTQKDPERPSTWGKSRKCSPVMFLEVRSPNILASSINTSIPHSALVNHLDNRNWWWWFSC